MTLFDRAAVKDCVSCARTNSSTICSYFKTQPKQSNGTTSLNSEQQIISIVKTSKRQKMGGCDSITLGLKVMNSAGIKL
jgi:hypothetical protein